MFKDSIVAIVTPMLKTGEIDKKAFGNLIEMHIANGTNAIVVNGTTGESATLTFDEAFDLIKYAIDVSNKRIPIIAGTGCNSTALTIENTKKVYSLGVDACLVVAPYYNRPTQEGMYLHYESLANSVNIPIILYNVPTRTSCDLLPQTVARLSKIKNIYGIKDATGEIERVEYFKNNCNKDFKFFSGDDASCLEFIEKGGHGVISVSANIFPKLMSQMCEFIAKKDLRHAHELNNKLKILHAATMVEANPIPVKWALNYLGYIESGIRLPLTELTLPNQKVMKEALKVFIMSDSKINYVG